MTLTLTLLGVFMAALGPQNAPIHHLGPWIPRSSVASGLSRCLR